MRLCTNLRAVFLLCASAATATAAAAAAAAVPVEPSKPGPVPVHPITPTTTSTTTTPPTTTTVAPPLITTTTTAAPAHNSSTINHTDYVQIVAGVAFGFFLEEDNIQIADPCIDGMTGVEKEFADIMGLLSQKSASSALRALELVSQAFHGMGSAVEQCGATADQVSKVYAALRAFRNPLTFFYRAGKNLMLNGKEIYNELEAAADNYFSRQYRPFGYEIGLAMHKVVLGFDRLHREVAHDPIELAPQDAVDVVLGLAQGFSFGEVDIEPECVNDAQELWFDIERAFSYFSQLDEKDAIRGLQDLSKAMEIVHDALRDCKASEDHLKALMQSIAMIRNPINFAYVIGKHIIVDRIEIFHELNAAADDWATAHFRSFGFQLGLICSQILVGQPAVVVPPNGTHPVVPVKPAAESDPSSGARSHNVVVLIA